MPVDRPGNRLALGGLIVGAWGALLLWGASPYAELLGHEANGIAAGSPLAIRLSAFVLGRTLMTVAMMLPSSLPLVTVAMMLPSRLPLVTLFRRAVVARADARRRLARLLAGYLLVWVLFGVAAYLGDLGLHAAVAAAPGLGTARRSRV